MFSNIVSIWALLGVFVASPVDSTPVEIPQRVSFNVFYNVLNIENQVNLMPAETFLANENLPVWTPEEQNPAELRSINSVMKELGPFTVYRDPNTCSAALYFHEKKQFEGTIGHHHIIHELDYNPITKGVEVSESTVFALPSQAHGNRRNEDMKFRMVTGDTALYSRIKSLRKYPDTVYVEILVIVYHDITRDLEYDYPSVVTHVLTLFNSVDMLYSKIKIPNIKINIAGIIIGYNEYSFPRFQMCHEKNRDGNVVTSALDLDCAYIATQNTLDDYQLPFQSYDVVVLLTRAILYDRDVLERAVLGISFTPLHNNGYKQSMQDIRIAIISDRKNLECFSTLAHEVAHLLGVPHDGGPLWKNDGTCVSHLMKRDHSICMKCLKFGGKSPKHFQTFFGTREACIFHNKPRSLANPPGPQLFWRKDEQCECYGYKSIYNPKKSLLTCHVLTRQVECDNTLKCLDDKREIHDTNFYMDGTPCGKNQVCWNKQCVPIRKGDEKKTDDNGGSGSGSSSQSKME